MPSRPTFIDFQHGSGFARASRTGTPDMPGLDESKLEPVPEVDINPKDDHWVNPSVPLEALLDLD